MTDLEKFQQWLDARYGPEKPSKKAPGSTLAAKGKRAKRLEGGDLKCKAEVWARESDCVICAEARRPEGYIPIHDWAHIEGRNVAPEKRQSAQDTTRLCRVHHSWHNATSGYVLKIKRDGDTQYFMVDGELVAERKI